LIVGITLLPTRNLFLRFGTRMKSQFLVIGVIGVTALTLAGCQRHKRADVVVGGHTLAVSERLVCPEQQGAFRRTAQADDGQSCDYVGSED